MKLKTTIYGKSSTLIGTPDEISALLDAVRRTARQRAVDRLPQVAKLDAGERVLAQVNGHAVERKSGPIPFKPTFEPIAQTREEIVNEAIADVAGLLNTVPPSRKLLFNVNRKKRVVSAVLIFVLTGNKKNTGIARCAPSDVFNEHVGKAIALRRALGLEVPAKYYEVGGIAPEGKQVGDVIKFKTIAENVYQTTLTDDVSQVGGPWCGKTMLGSRHSDISKVIDDSARYVAPSTSAAKVVYHG